MNVKCFFFLLVFFFAFWITNAEAARQFTIAQNPALGTQFDMDSTQSITYTITNTNTGGNAGERIYEMRFRINTGSTFSSATAAPAGWTRTAYSTTSVTFRATSWANSIVTGSSLGFTLVIVMRSTTADVNETLQDARASYTLDTDFSNGITRAGRTTTNTPGSWTLKSLSMTLVPSTFSVGTGCTFTLTMTVTNKSTSNITGVTSVTYPPTRTGVSATTTSNPGAFNLNAGATGTMVWTYTAGSTAGTLTFTAYAQDTATTHKSSSVTTSTITVSSTSCTFTVTSLVITPACLFSGDPPATITMIVSNTTGGGLSNVAPSALAKFGTAVIGAFTGPTPVSIASLANGATGTFTWTAPITGNVNDTYYVTGFATANGPIQTAIATSDITEDVDGYIVTVNPPASTNASSTNEELVWTITNNACNNINQVSIAVPVGWTASSDGYAVVYNTAGSLVDTWTLAGTTFTSPNATDRIPPPPVVNTTGDFYLVFSATPSLPETTTFNITVTDSTGMSKTVQSTVTVNAFGSGGLNDVGTGAWKESY